jgi:hypothetical protein
VCCVVAALTTESFRVLRQLALQWKIAWCFSATKAGDGLALIRDRRAKMRLRTTDLTQLTAARVVTIGCNSYESLKQSYLRFRARCMRQYGSRRVRLRISRCKQYSLAHNQVQA